MSKCSYIEKHMDSLPPEKNKFFHSKYFYFGLVILTLAAGAWFLFGPMVFGELIFPQKSAAQYHYMYFNVMKYFVYDLHMLPNWWPAYHSGYPIHLTLDGFMNPIFIVTLKFLPAFLANNLLVFVFFVINGLSLYAFTRALKLSRSASLVSAISYAFSGVIITYAPITGITTLMPFLPLSFLCSLKIMQGNLKWLWLWLPLLTYSWFGGWSEMIIYALVAAGIFTAYLFIKNRGTEHSSYSRPVLLLTSVIASVLILLPWFLSILGFIATSSRTGGIPLKFSGFMPTTLSHLAHMLYPRLTIFYGELLPFFSFSNNDHFLYFGVLPLFLAFASFFIKDKKSKEHLIFFLSLAVGALLMTVKNSPLFWLFHHLPVLRWFNGYWKWSFVIVFSLAILAGYGMDYIRDFFQRRFSKYAVIGLWTLLLVAILGIGAITIFEKQIQTSIISYGVAHYQNTPNRVFSRSDSYYQGVIEKMSGSLLNAFSFQNGWGEFTIILWLIVVIHITLGKYELISQQKWKLLSVAITFLGSVFVWNGFYGNTPASYLTTEPATAQYLPSVNPYQSNSLPLTPEKPALQPYRIFVYTPDQFIAELSEAYKIDLANTEFRDAFTREMLDSNTHVAFNFDTFYNHQALASQRLLEVYYFSKRQARFTKESYMDTTPFEEYVQAFSEKKNSQLLGMLNIKYILTPLTLKNERKPIFTTHINNSTLPVYIYENPYFLPRWYFAKNIQWTETENAFEVFKTIDDFNRTTLLEKLTLNDAALVSKADPRDTLELQLYTAGTLRIKTNTQNHRFLVFSENRQPCWKVMINGKPAPLYTANYLFQAVLVPPGENIVEFRFPSLWEQGLLSLQSRIQSFFQ